MSERILGLIWRLLHRGLLEPDPDHLFHLNPDGRFEVDLDKRIDFERMAA